MGMNLDGPLYLQRHGLLTPEKNRILDIGPQNIYHVRDEQIREFVGSQGQKVGAEQLKTEIERLVYYSTPRPGERTTLFPRSPTLRTSNTIQSMSAPASRPRFSTSISTRSPPT
ncbi:hypothetical protein ACU4GH_35955 [Bradyrhizobium betae]